MTSNSTQRRQTCCIVSVHIHTSIHIFIFSFAFLSGVIFAFAAEFSLSPAPHPLFRPFEFVPDLPVQFPEQSHPVERLLLVHGQVFTTYLLVVGSLLQVV